jgi:hypothetical protein
VGLFETLAQIDRKIRRLKEARALLDGSHFLGHPRKRSLTPDCRGRIAKTVKQPWAVQNESPIIEAECGWVTGKRPATHLACQPPQI